MAEQVFLEGDDEIRGQKFVCLSFISPEKVLKNKDMFFFSKFLEFYALDYKVRATESFVMSQLRDVQNVLSDVVNDLENLTPDMSGNVKELSVRIAKVREDLSKKTATDLETHVKTNMSDFRETTLQESYESYMMVNRTRLEDEFHKANKFRTTIRGLKIRGSYSTHEQAAARAQQLNKKDPYFNVYVADVGEWLPWDPEPEEVQEQKYQNEQLNTLMQSYRDNLSKKDAFFEEQKREKMAEAAKMKVKGSSEAAVFGEKGKEQEAVEVARGIFDGAPDLALQRKMENSVQHA